MKQSDLPNRANILSAAGAVLAATLLMGFSAISSAQPMATQSNSVYSGTGCPAGSVNAAIINGGRTLRVSFQAFKVFMNGNSGKPVAECEISVFLTASAKQMLEISPADYNGSYSARAQITLNAGHWWANKQAGPWAGGTAGTGAAGAFRLNNPNKTAFGACGGKNELKDDRAKGIKLTIKPADMVSAELKFVDYTLNYAPCDGNSGGTAG